MTCSRTAASRTACSAPVPYHQRRPGGGRHPRPNLTTSATARRSGRHFREHFRQPGRLAARSARAEAGRHAEPGPHPAADRRPDRVSGGPEVTGGGGLTGDPSRRGTDRAVAPPEPLRTPHGTTGWWSWVTTVDHKRIASSTRDGARLLPGRRLEALLIRCSSPGPGPRRHGGPVQPDLQPCTASRLLFLS